MTNLMSLTVNLPRHIANIFFFLIGSKKRIIWNHWLFNYQIKLNYSIFETLKKYKKIPKKPKK